MAITSEQKKEIAWNVGWAVVGAVAGIGVSFLIGGTAAPVIAKESNKIVKGLMIFGSAAAGGILGAKVLEETIEEGKEIRQVIIDGKKLYYMHKERKEAENV